VGTGWNGNELGGDGWERKLNLWRWVEMGAIWATMQLCIYHILPTFGAAAW